MKGKHGEGKAPEFEAERRGVPHLIGNIVGIAIIAVLLPVMVANLTLIIKSYTRPNDVPTVFGVAPLIVTSGSMEPTILEDDLIFVRRADTAALKKGDVIAFQPIGKTVVVTHRITQVFEENGAPAYRTKGDANNTEDVDPVLAAQVVGQYFGRVEGLGKAAMFLQKPVGIVVFVAIPLLLFVAYDMLRRALYNKKHKNDRSADQEELERLRALAAALEQGGEDPPAEPAEPLFVPSPGIASAAYPPIEGEPEAEPEAEPDLDEDDEDEV
ncbi:MAG: signal peptidase I [Oscillospiraceae bacterium]|jgi:signal peptidase|nr:signal peptidase I [Oscillospiraceae bacterium]